MKYYKMFICEYKFANVVIGQYSGNISGTSSAVKHIGINNQCVPALSKKCLNGSTCVGLQYFKISGTLLTT